MKKVHIKSYGCQMNVYDGQRMADVLGQEGYVETATPDDADAFRGVRVATVAPKGKAASVIADALAGEG